MPEAVVDALETVEVNEQDREPVALRRRFENGLLEQLGHAPAVVKTRETVPVGQLERVGLALLEQVDFTQQSGIDRPERLQFHFGGGAAWTFRRIVPVEVDTGEPVYPIDRGRAPDH